METLHIDSGAVTVSINNDENRTITFYPTDVRFAEAFFDLARGFQEKQAEADEKLRGIRESGADAVQRSAAEFEVMHGVYAFMRAKIDEVFGPGTAQTVFGSHDSLGAYASFFRGLTPYVQRARRAEVERYMEKGGQDAGVMDA